MEAFALIAGAAGAATLAHVQPGVPVDHPGQLGAGDEARARVARVLLSRHGLYVAWLVALGPAALVAALVAWTRRARASAVRRGVKRLFAVTVPASVQLALLGGYQDISYSPRYLLPALAGALCLPAAHAIVADIWGGAGRAACSRWRCALLVDRGCRR